MLINILKARPSHFRHTSGTKAVAAMDGAPTIWK